HRPRLRHVVVALPSAVILVPLPNVAVESHLAVNLELVHVNRLAEELCHRLDHSRVAREPGDRSAVHVRRGIRAHGIAAFLAHVPRPLLCVERRYFVREHLDLRRREMAGKEKVAVAFEVFLLAMRELHIGSVICGDMRESSYATPSTPPAPGD